MPDYLVFSLNLVPENIFLFRIGSKMRCHFTERRRTEANNWMSGSDVSEVKENERGKLPHNELVRVRVRVLVRDRFRVRVRVRVRIRVR